MKKEKLFDRTIIWTITVWTLSFACYLPTLLENDGVGVPKELTAAKYFFIIVPLAVSVVFAASHGEFKRRLRGRCDVIYPQN